MTVTDYEAYRAAVMRSLFPYEQLEDGYLLITSEDFTYSRMTLVVASLNDRERTVGGQAKMRTEAGFLEVLSVDGATYSLPGEDRFVTDTSHAYATAERDANGKLLFRTAAGNYEVWSFAEEAMIAANWNERDARGLPFVPPLSWFSASDDAPYLIRDEETGLYGYARAGVNEEGETVDVPVVEAQFAVAYPYNEGYAVAIDPDGREHVFDRDGTELFTDLTLLAFEETGEALLGYPYVQDGILRAVEEFTKEDGEEEVRQIILKMNGGRVALPLGFEALSYSEGVFVLSNGENVGYFSADGKWIADPIYWNGGAFREGMAVVQNAEGYYGMIDAKGVEQIPCVFSYLAPFSDGVAVLYSDEDGWQLLYKINGIFGERGDEKTPIVTDKPFVTRIPVSRNSDSGRDDTEIFIFPTVLPPRHTTVPEWTQRPRPTVAPPSTQAPDPTEPQTTEPATGEPVTPPSPQPPDPTEGRQTL